MSQLPRVTINHEHVNLMTVEGRLDWAGLQDLQRHLDLLRRRFLPRSRVRHPAPAASRPARPMRPAGVPVPGGRTHLSWISDQVSAVLDPLAVRCDGWPPPAIRLALAREWRRAFHAELGEPGLTDTAAAIHAGRPWSDVLWADGW
jgi:hypothetical protein